MIPHYLVTFALVYAFSVVSPGPGVAAVIGRSLAQGTRGVPAFLAGFIVGDLIWLTLTVVGLAAAARTFAGAFTVLKFAGALYLLYLAWQMWRDSGRIVVDPNAAPRTQPPAAAFMGSLALTLGNPKAMVFYLAVVPSIVPLAELDARTLSLLVVMVLLINPLGLGLYAYGAARAQRLFADPRRLRIVNRSIGTLLAIIAIALLRS